MDIEIPKNTRLPFTYLQFDSTLAGSELQGVQPYRCLLIAKHGGTEDQSPADKPVQLSSEAVAKTTFGDGSYLHKMAKAYFSNSSIEVWGATISDVDGSKLFASIAGIQFNVMAIGASDQALLTGIGTLMKPRATATRGVEGIAIACHSGPTTESSTIALTVNSPFVCIVAQPHSASLDAEVAAAICGQVAMSAQDDPARPFKTLELSGVQAPNREDMEGRDAHEAALENGVSTLYVDASGQLRIERLVTTYTKDPTTGALDSSYMSPSTVLLLSFLRWDFARYFGLKYPRHKLASNHFRGTGPVMTPNIARSECVALFRRWEEQGYVQDADAFIASLVCEVDPSDKSRLNITLQPKLVSELAIIGAVLRFQF